MSDNKKYYYIKIKENFFDDERIKIIESIDNGIYYSNLLLKLYLKSLKTDGQLRFTATIPYNEKMISTITNLNIDIVRSGLRLLIELQFIEKLDDGTLYMTEIQNYIGNSSSEADRKRAYRNKIESNKFEIGTNVRTNVPKIRDICMDKNPPEIELELELEKEIDKEYSDSIESHSSQSNKIKKIDYKEIKDLFNKICVTLPKVRDIENSRKNTLRIWLSSEEINLKEFFTIVNNSDFLSGRNGKWQNCCFDWIIKPSNRIKILDGNYNNKKNNNNISNCKKPQQATNYEQRIFDEDETKYYSNLKR